MAYATQLSTHANPFHFLSFLPSNKLDKAASKKAWVNSSIRLVDLKHQERLALIRQWKQHSAESYSESAELSSYTDGVIVDFKQSNKSRKQHTRASIIANDEWEVVLPTNTVGPYETIIRPVKGLSSMAKMSARQENSLEQILIKLATRYDNLFLSTLRCKISWLFNTTTASLEARYQPLDVENSYFNYKDASTFSKRLANLADIHFKDVFCS